MTSSNFGLTRPILPNQNKTLVGLLDHDMDPKEFAARSHAAPVFKKDSKVSFTQHALEATQVSKQTSGRRFEEMVSGSTHPALGCGR